MNKMLGYVFVFALPLTIAIISNYHAKSINKNNCKCESDKPINFFFKLKYSTNKVDTKSLKNKETLREGKIILKFKEKKSKARD